MERQVKPKVTARVDYDRARPASPFKQPATSLSPPLIRAKAKVNSSATIQTRKPGVPPLNTQSTRPTTAPNRAPSPFKPPQSRVANASPTTGSAVKARLTARTNGNNSTSPLPESRQRALTAGTPPAPSFPRQRRGSASSNVLSTPSHTESAASSPARSALTNSDENTPISPNVSVRVKAKISKVAGHGALSPPSLPASPLLANRPARVPSISNLSLSPPMMPSNGSHSPSSATSSPSAPPLRFGSTRETKHQSFQPIPKAFHAFVPNDDTAVDYGSVHKITAKVAKVDPAAIPLPPQSPPTSTVSFSSRSSASRSSASYDTQESGFSQSTAPTLNSHLNGNGGGHARHGSRSSQPRVSLDGYGSGPRSAPPTREHSSNSEAEYSDEYEGDARHDRDDDDSEDEERKMKAQAKSNRKIEDLEITNRSLLAINATLEATKHRQAKEIRELRRKLRESRLILPPPTFRAVKSSLTHDDTAEEDEEDEEEDDEDDEEENQAIVEGKADEAYRRVKIMIDTLLDSGRRALESKPEDFVGTGKGGAKVLTAEEVRSWRGEDDTIGMGGLRPLTPSRIAVPDSEDEVEATLVVPSVLPPAPLPPITITPSASP
ncbi:hypothetical protein C8Q74DRAFT_1364324 [Fomes fomentarius]|nr:hypothetical protein C8Q74DRAFT_1364324 [Fomes fomentarius]